MKINNLVEQIKKKISKNIKCRKILIVDKTFLHKKHKNFNSRKFHLKITIESPELTTKKKIDANRYIFTILDKELKNYVHSIQLFIN